MHPEEIVGMKGGSGFSPVMEGSAMTGSVMRGIVMRLMTGGTVGLEDCVDDGSSDAVILLELNANVKCAQLRRPTKILNFMVNLEKYSMNLSSRKGHHGHRGGNLVLFYSHLETPG